MPKFCVVILSRDRVDLIEETILSLIHQKIMPDKIIISDNSLHHQNEIIKISNKYKQIELILNDNLEISDHYFKILQTLNYDLIAICHDDDIIMPNFVEEILKIYKKNDKASIYGVNGKSFNKKLINKNLLWSSKKKYLKVDHDNLMLRWFDIDSGGVFSFPGAVFNMKILKKNLINIKPNYNEGYNYWDTFFCKKISRISYLIWINEDLIRYRIHDNSLSNNSNLHYKKAYQIMKKELDISLKLKNKIEIYRQLHFLLNIINKKKFANKVLFIKLLITLMIRSKYVRKSLFSMKLFTYIKKITSR
jgi:hypothetical protein